MFQTLKEQLRQEENAINTIKKHYPHLKYMKDNDILRYLGLSYRREAVVFIQALKRMPKTDIPNIPYTHHICSCTDAEGEIKYLYSTLKEAKEICKLNNSRIKGELKVYPCPESAGWHLSKV